MNIYIDADACPVNNIVIEEARKANIPVILVKSFSHYSNKEDPTGVTSIYVDHGADAADYRIMALAKSLDIIITQDYGLASLALGKGCIVLHHKGFKYTINNMDELLQTRHANAKARRGGFKTRGPKALTESDREKFRSVLLQEFQNQNI
ncbi:YaiI/YqxD family protein [Aquibacillus rhizosphaerae]|uniref:UPF0178 protein QQS35_03970 n=1 Tax=Aquibacillus rhizosphaerae TaxID=3051431 RepID=A0ABT7L359_9BACI|nr:YaiI/YqxD family protein [Aquibacillus sp. LR5S19]MDL4839615.1 YaiI/YqxD family protein [Aquibacillus sp. LR5S19]